MRMYKKIEEIRVIRSTMHLSVIISLLFVVVPTGIASAENPTDLAKDYHNELLLLSTLDGSFICLDQATGHMRWKLKEEPIVRVPMASNTALVPLFLPDPKDGSLYKMGGSEREALTKLPFTIPQLVASSPCRSSDGILYTGRKVDTWFSVNPLTGVKKPFLSFNNIDSTCPRESSDAIFIGRTEYNILMFDPRKREKSWNVTFFDYSSCSMDAETVLKYDYVHFTGSSSGRVLTLKRDTGSLSWQTDHDSPVVAMYQLRSQGLVNVPFTSIAETTLDHLIDEVTMRKHSRLGIEFKTNELKLFPTLYVGEHIHGLYALPSLVDQNTATIALAHKGPLLLEGPSHPTPVSGQSDGGKFKLVDKQAEREQDEVNETQGEKTLPIVLLGHYNVPDYSQTRLQIAGKVIENETSAEKAKSVAIQTDEGFTPEPETLDITQFYDIVAEMSRGNITVKQTKKLFTLGYTMLCNVVEEQENIEIKTAMLCLIIFVFSMAWYLNKQVKDFQQMSQGSRTSERSTGGTGGSSKVTALPVELGAGVIKIGKIKFDSAEVLGKGCEGTFVFKGEFDGRSVAVKRLLPECFTFADREVELLRESDEHANVVRYYCTEQDKQFRYIALELCAATLKDFVEGKFLTDFISPLEMLRQATCGLQHLHSLHIVHRDIKPHNVLISMPNAMGEVRAMISDFGLCKKLKLGRASFSRRSGVTGTDGWIAPEMLTGETRTTCSVDIFSMGCVYYYVLTNGKHPFGDALHRQANIISGEPSLGSLQQDNQLALTLIQRMLDAKPAVRPPATAVLKYPLFWPESKVLIFFQDVSDRTEKEDAESFVLRSLEESGADVVRGDWRTHIDAEVAQDLRKYRNYRGNSVRDLLRALRNKKHHYRELSAQAQKNLGENPTSFVQYWTTRFPLLLVHSWLSMQCVRSEPTFGVYYDIVYVFPALPSARRVSESLTTEGFLLDKTKKERTMRVPMSRERSPKPGMRRDLSPGLLSTNWRSKTDNLEENWRTTERRLSEPKNFCSEVLSLDNKNSWYEQWLLSDFRDDNAYIKWRETEFYKNLRLHRGERDDASPFVPEFPTWELCERLRQQRRSLDEATPFLDPQNFERGFSPHKLSPRNGQKKVVRRPRKKTSQEPIIVWNLPP